MIRIRILMLAAASLLIPAFPAALRAAPPAPAAHLIPGPGEPGYDADLALKARRFDRQFHVFNAAPMGVNADASVSPDKPENRKLVEDFIMLDDGWDFEKFSGGRSVRDVIGGWQKVAGLYAGMGIAADAFRYAVLRDENASPSEIAVAREQLMRSLDALHQAFTIPGKPGVVARGYIKKDLPGFAAHVKPLPLRDEQGRPLPLVKDNGQWREDFSGQYPGYVWEDSISRDQMLGWAFAAAAAAEVMRGDDSFSDTIRKRLADDSAAFVHALMQKHPGGWDLEFPDADGRTTLYGYLHESNLDGQYIHGLKNGFYTAMALGTVAALNYASGDPEGERYLRDILLKKRHFADIAEHHMKFIDMGLGTNYSNVNMVFTAIWLAIRYIDDPATHTKLIGALKDALYGINSPGINLREMKQSLFDLIYASSMTGGTAFSGPSAAPESVPVEHALETLRGFPGPPFWSYRRENCDSAEMSTGDCTLGDGTKVRFLGPAGWKESLIAGSPIPMSLRPPSNYYWRSNPYEPNGGADSSDLLPAVDFRIAYWLGRWFIVPARQ